MSLSYSSVAAPVWNDADHASILCTVQFAGMGAPVPFIAMASDPGAGAAIFAACVAGTYGAIGAYVAPTPTLAQMQSALIAAASAASAAIVAQIYSDPAHQAAGQNAAMIVGSAGGTAPGSGSPFYAAFNAYATLFGMTPNALATLAIALTNQSFALSAALSALEAATAAASSAGALATALASYEAALTTVVAAINAAGPPAPIVASVAIVVVGVNG